MKACVLSIVFLTLLLDLQGQVKKFPSDKSEKEKFEEAQKLFAESDFEKAYEYYDYLEQVNPGHIQVQLPMALCVQNLEPDVKIVLSFFERIREKDRIGNEFSFYYALALHNNYQFEEAIYQMNVFLKQGKFSGKQKEVAEKTITYCENALELAYNKTIQNTQGDGYMSEHISTDTVFYKINTVRNNALPVDIKKDSENNKGLITQNANYNIPVSNAGNEVKAVEPCVNSELKIMPLSEFLDFTHPELSFRIQVGVFCLPENMKKDKFGNELKCVKEATEKGGVRYTIQDFKTLREAYAYRDELIAKGMKDAFVTSMFKDKRTLLVDVRMEIAKSLAFEIN
ncbi:MAG TPA: hypothetical protein VK177_10690 [Flavobacteriales bacterium]|nr:hypothetical protein [Flavobacteriales bacterium]